MVEYCLQKKTNTDQSTLLVFLLCANRNESQTFKSSSYQFLFLQCVDSRCKLPWWIFFIQCDNSKTLILIKKLSHFQDFFNRHVVAFFETSVLKEVCVLCYLIITLYVMTLLLTVYTSLHKWIFLKNLKLLWKMFFTQ